MKYSTFYPALPRQFGNSDEKGVSGKARVIKCINRCKSLDYKFSGLHNGGECYCGTGYDKAVGFRNFYGCSEACGNETYKTKYRNCGHQSAIAVYTPGNISKLFFVCLLHKSIRISNFLEIFAYNFIIHLNSLST